MPTTPNRHYRLGEDSEVDPIDALNQFALDVDADIAQIVVGGVPDGGAPTNFDIHGLAAISDATEVSELTLWDSVSGALRKITAQNLLKTRVTQAQLEASNADRYTKTESDDRYYTKTYLDGALIQKSAFDNEVTAREAGDNLRYTKTESDARYYSRTYLDNAFSQKADGAALTSGLAGKFDANRLGVANGAASLDGNGKVFQDQLPSISLGESFPVASQAAMLALTAQIGDVAIRSDLNNRKFLLLGNAATLADWVDFAATGAVASVNGRTGAVVISKSDVGLANAENTSDLNKPISTATQAALTSLSNSVSAKATQNALDAEIARAKAAEGLKINADLIGVALGVVPLDSNVKIDPKYLPATGAGSGSGFVTGQIDTIKGTGNTLVVGHRNLPAVTVDLATTNIGATFQAAYRASHVLREGAKIEGVFTRAVVTPTSGTGIVFTTDTPNTWTGPSGTYRYAAIYTNSSGNRFYTNDTYTFNVVNGQSAPGLALSNANYISVQWYIAEAPGSAILRASGSPVNGEGTAAQPTAPPSGSRFDSDIVAPTAPASTDFTITHLPEKGSLGTVSVTAPYVGTTALPKSASESIATEAATRAAADITLQTNIDAKNDSNIFALDVTSGNAPSLLRSVLANIYATLTSALANKISRNEVGAANGVAPLGADSKVPAQFLPVSSGGGVAPADALGISWLFVPDWPNQEGGYQTVSMPVANTVFLTTLQVFSPITISKTSFWLSNNSEKTAVGIYDASGNRLTHASFAAGIDSVQKRAPLLSSVVLQPGFYLVAISANGINASWFGSKTSHGIVDNIFSPFIYTAANPSVNGVLPTTLGAITPVESNKFATLRFS